MNQRHNILIPDGASTWAMAVINCLSQCDNYKLFVLSNKKRTPAKYSRFTSYYKYYSRSSDEQWLKVINDEIEKHDISVVVPIAEKEIRFLINHKPQISKSSKIIPLPTAKAFEIAIDKYKLSVYLLEHQIAHPKSFLLKNIEAAHNILESMDFPVLVKPFNEKGGDGILRFDNASDLQTILKSKKEVFIQEYIRGYDIDCSVLCNNGEILAYTIQKGFLPGRNDYEPQLGFNFLHNEAVVDIVGKTMEALNWTGLAHVDLRYDKKKQVFMVIEINARFWGSLEASRFAGINFADLVIKRAFGDIVTNQVYKPISFLRFKGYLKMIKRRPLSIFNIRYMLNNTETKSVLKDPLPTVYRFMEWCRRIYV